MQSNQLELLAPARDAAIGIEAVNHGADAVYIGAPAFGARAGAGNELASIAGLIEHAHRYHARIYITLNTILRDDELEPARKLAWDCYHMGADALIIQDMGLLELDMPPMQLHASTQCDIRTPEKAKFLQDVGFSQLVLARELDLQQIAEIRAATSVPLEFFIHGALCVAYSGQCYISHAQTGRSANRGDCSQACRLPYQVKDQGGRIIAYDKHVLSLKDNDQSANLAALVDAGIQSFKIEGRYKDMAYVKNVTAHYRVLLDQLMEQRPGLKPASSGRCTFSFSPDPSQNFNRGATDYFVQGRQQDIGAFDSPKNPGQPIGHLVRIHKDHLEVESNAELHNGDGLCYYDLRNDLQGLAVNTATQVKGKLWRIEPKDRVQELKGLRVGMTINRNRDMAWVRMLERKSAERRIPLTMILGDTTDGLVLKIVDDEGHQAQAEIQVEKQPPKDAQKSESSLRDNLSKLGASLYQAQQIQLNLQQPWFVPASSLNALRRDAIAQLDEVRAEAFQPLPKATPQAANYPKDALSYLANVYNSKAKAFYEKHGVRLVEPAYESHQALGEVSLMITKHCIRYSLSLCPRQTQGVTGVHGTVKAEPLRLVQGDEELMLRFDCKACEMHVLGKIRKEIVRKGR